MPDTLTLYNTLTRRAEPFVPRDGRGITIYTCGPTVYDDAHIGNFRSFLVADLARRWIASPLCGIEGGAGPRRVTQVMNITDVGHMTEDDAADGGGEDKMAVAGRRIAEAKKAGTLPAGVEVDPGDPRAIAVFFAGRFTEDARALGLSVAEEAARDATVMPRASEHVAGMIEAVRALEAHGFAYVRGAAGSRAVYFSVEKFAGYGELSGNDLERLRGGAGGRVSEGHQAEKKHPADFLLWKEDPKHLMKWDSPWGMGYPGWHIECTVMSLDRLVEGGLARVVRRDAGGAATIDLHTGGEDNIFPHHECERAQSCALTGGAVFARHWLHTRFLMVNGEKMSKSKGTFYTPRQLMAEGHEAGAIRFELLKTHYRANAEFSLEGLIGSAKTVERWRRFAEAGEGSAEAGVEPAEARAAFVEAMQDDLNIARAIGAVNKWMNGVATPTKADAALVREIDDVVGVVKLKQAAATKTEIGKFIGVEPDARVEALLGERAAARKAKDFARADAIREELAGLGLAIKDAAGGRVEVTRLRPGA